MSAQFNGKVAIVTGSSAGLGEAIALTLASRGANVTFCGRNPERLSSVVNKAITISGGDQGRFLAVEGDLTDATVRKEIIDTTVEKFGRLDILVANAGIAGANASFSTETEDDYDNILDTNLKSVFFLIQLAVPHLEKTRGNIVNISSIITSIITSQSIVYALSKAALDHLTRCLAVDLGPRGIRVNSVNPGAFKTLILRNLENVDKFFDEFVSKEREKQPLKGRNGVVEDVAEAVTFLASDQADFITGELIKVDGGRSFIGP